MVRSLRAHFVVSALSLSIVSGCVLLTGVGDLVVDDVDGGGALVGNDGAIGTADVSPPQPTVDSSAETKDTSAPDARDADVPDTDVPDTNVPDTGAPDTGSPADSGPVSTSSVRCTESKTCSGATPVCCFSSFFPFGSCSASAAGCNGVGAYVCDDDADCANGTVCCATWSSIAVGGSTQCAASCATSTTAFGGTGRVCSTNQSCTGQDESCETFNPGPSTIKACQVD